MSDMPQELEAKRDVLAKEWCSRHGLKIESYAYSAHQDGFNACYKLMQERNEVINKRNESNREFVTEAFKLEGYRMLTKALKERERIAIEALKKISAWHIGDNPADEALAKLKEQE